MSEAEIDALATRFFAAIETGDAETIGRLYAEDAQVWHNVSGAAQSREENLRLLAYLAKRIRGWRYDDVRRRCFPDGFVQQHVLRGHNTRGEAVAVAACIVAEVADGCIVRIDEYLDAEAARPLFAD